MYIGINMKKIPINDYDELDEIGDLDELDEYEDGQEEREYDEEEY